MRVQEIEFAVVLAVSQHLCKLLFKIYSSTIINLQKKIQEMHIIICRR